MRMISKGKSCRSIDSFAGNLRAVTSCLLSVFSRVMEGKGSPTKIGVDVIARPDSVLPKTTVNDTSDATINVLHLLKCFM
jgi:hypothetical protein